MARGENWRTALLDAGCRPLGLGRSWKMSRAVVVSVMPVYVAVCTKASGRPCRNSTGGGHSIGPKIAACVFGTLIVRELSAQ